MQRCCTPVHIYSDANPIMINGTCCQESVHRVAASEKCCIVLHQLCRISPQKTGEVAVKDYSCRVIASQMKCMKHRPFNFGYVKPPGSEAVYHNTDYWEAIAGQGDVSAACLGSPDTSLWRRAFGLTKQGLFYVLNGLHLESILSAILREQS